MKKQTGVVFVTGVIVGALLIGGIYGWAGYFSSFGLATKPVSDEEKDGVKQAAAASSASQTGVKNGTESSRQGEAFDQRRHQRSDGGRQFVL